MAVHAIYEDGALRLLEPVDLANGEVVEVNYRKMDERDAARVALGDLVRWHDPDAPVPLPELSDEELLETLNALSDGDDWASRYILEEREDRF
jgi:predicted DNA-binding antitoxin AbrB/MazE fold protein